MKELLYSVRHIEDFATKRKYMAVDASGDTAHLYGPALVTELGQLPSRATGEKMETRAVLCLHASAQFGPVNSSIR